MLGIPGNTLGSVPLIFRDAYMLERHLLKTFLEHTCPQQVTIYGTMLTDSLGLLSTRGHANVLLKRLVYCLCISIQHYCSKAVKSVFAAKMLKSCMCPLEE